MAMVRASIGRRIQFGAACTISGAMLLGGCADGVEMNGRLLDAVGMSTAALNANRVEPKLQPRAPLVMPPTSERLPDPNAPPPPVAAIQDPAWPKDADQQRVASAADKVRQHEQYCKDGNWKERAVDNDSPMQGPMGTCGSIFTWTQNLFGSGNSSGD